MINQACNEHMGNDSDWGALYCTRRKGHEGHCGSVTLLAEYCGHPTQVNGRCAVCGSALPTETGENDGN